MSLRVDGVSLRVYEDSGFSVFGNPLYSYQRRVYEAGERVLAVSAPTGGGKTLALVIGALRSIGTSPTEGKTGVIIYPTKSLLEEQAEQIFSLINGLTWEGRRLRAGLLTPESHVEGDITVFPVDADTLEALASRGDRPRPHGVPLLSALRSTVGPLLILTNFDLFFTVLAKRFYMGESIFQRLVSTIGFLGVDEIHLYHGHVLANLAFFLHALRGKVDRYMFTSATHSEEVLAFLRSLFGGDFRLIEAEVGEGRPVRHPVELEFESNPDGFVMKSGEAVESVAGAVERLYESTSPTPKPRVVAIVNSVAFAETLGRRLRERYDVSLIHGFVPREMRRLDAEVVVGTRAIEVGIDFNAQALVFEASDSSTFIQRFGRVGRKRGGAAVAYVPAEERLAVADSVSGDIGYRDFEALIHRVFREEPYYTGYAGSDHGLIQLSANILTLLSMPKKEAAPKFFWKNLKEYLGRLSPWDGDAWRRVISLRKRISPKRFKELVLSLQTKFGPKGLYPSIPACFTEYGVFRRIGVADLDKLDFEVTAAGDPGLRGRCRGAARIKGGETIVLVRGVNPDRRLGIVTNARVGELFVLGEENFDVVVEGAPELREPVFQALKGAPAIHVNGPPYDWRAMSIRCERMRGHTVVIGYDALVQWWCMEKGCRRPPARWRSPMGGSRGDRAGGGGAK